METIQFVGTTPKELREGVSEDIKNQLFAFFRKREDPEELLTREEAAKFLKIGLSTLKKWTDDSKLVAYGIGNRVYYKKSELMSSLQRLNE